MALAASTTRPVVFLDHLRLSVAPMGDVVRFEIGVGENLTGGTGGRRYPVTAWIGATPWATFRIDLVGTGVRMTGVPDHVPPVAGIALPGIEQPGYRAYPLVDHIADKVAAIIEPHGDGRPSTRFRDLIDLVSLVVSVRVMASEQGIAVLSEIERRGLLLPDRFVVPDGGLWAGGYANAVGRAVEWPATTLDGALANRWSVRRSRAGRHGSRNLGSRHR